MHVLQGSYAQHTTRKWKQGFNSSCRIREGFWEDMLSKLNQEEWVRVSQATKRERHCVQRKQQVHMHGGRKQYVQGITHKPLFLEQKSCWGTWRERWAYNHINMAFYATLESVGFTLDVMESHWKILTERVVWSAIRFGNVRPMRCAGG